MPNFSSIGLALPKGWCFFTRSSFSHKRKTVKFTLSETNSDLAWFDQLRCWRQFYLARAIKLFLLSFVCQNLYRNTQKSPFKLFLLTDAMLNVWNLVRSIICASRKNGGIFLKRQKFKKSHICNGTRTAIFQILWKSTFLWSLMTTVRFLFKKIAVFHLHLDKMFAFMIRFLY